MSDVVHFICKSSKQAVHRKDVTSVTILDELMDENATLESFVRDVKRAIVTCYTNYGNDYTLIIRDNQAIAECMHVLNKRDYNGDDYGKDCCRAITMMQCELMGSIINNAGNLVIIEKE